ncbi:heat shock protein Hsp15 [Chitinophaga niabensis]|uniref:Heat shock protein Hsp15 n=2 Tax=Chitinophaga niabensis TaxID=536979 RepID=A0A1N6J437_9BACT|nr:heat shock protein Hsp15 [Chitinophaga niabensis]
MMNRVYHPVLFCKPAIRNFAAMSEEKLRLDKYLWAIRIFKTRTQAAAACDASKVKLKGMAVKAAKGVSIGDQYDIKTEAKRWKIEVVGLLHNRVQYTEAIKYYVDITPEEDKQFNQRIASSFDTGKRQSKIGRPTKRERRDLDDFMRED